MGISVQIPASIYKIVSWDVDGTLFSYSGLAAALIRLAPLKIERVGWRRTIGDMRLSMAFHRLVERQRRGDSKVIEAELLCFEELQQREERALNAALAIMKPRPEAVALIRHLAILGIPQVAISDFDCSRKIRALGLSRYFERLYCCRRIGYWKPSMLPFRQVQHDFGISPDQHLHVGDRRDADGAGAAASGCAFLHVSEIGMPL